MKQKQTLFIMTGFLIISAALIIGLANTIVTTDHRNKSMMHAQKLDKNDNGTPGLYELTAPQDRHFATLDCDENWTIEKHEFNVRLINMFHRMDRDGDRVLQGDELTSHRYCGKQRQHGDKTPDPTKTG